MTTTNAPADHGQSGTPARTTQELRKEIGIIQASAMRGCEYFYELYRISFANKLRAWLATLQVSEQVIARELLSSGEF